MGLPSSCFGISTERKPTICKDFRCKLRGVQPWRRFLVSEIGLRVSRGLVFRSFWLWCLCLGSLLCGRCLRLLLGPILVGLDWCRRLLPGSVTSLSGCSSCYFSSDDLHLDNNEWLKQIRRSMENNCKLQSNSVDS